MDFEAPALSMGCPVKPHRMGGGAYLLRTPIYICFAAEEHQIYDHAPGVRMELWRCAGEVSAQSCIHALHVFTHAHNSVHGAEQSTVDRTAST